MSKLINKLTDKNDKKAYEYAKNISAKSVALDEYYECFEEFISLHLGSSLKILHDDKPTAVRQSLKALHEVAIY